MTLGSDREGKDVYIVQSIFFGASVSARNAVVSQYGRLAYGAYSKNWQTCVSCRVEDWSSVAQVMTGGERSLAIVVS